MKYGRIALFDVIVRFDHDAGRNFFSSLKVVLSPRGSYSLRFQILTRPGGSGFNMVT